MKGSAASGGTVSSEIAVELNLPMRLASAYLSNLVKGGYLVRVGKQPVPGDDSDLRPVAYYTVYVRWDELQLYDDVKED